MIDFICKTCGKPFTVTNDAAGKRTRCTSCGQRLQVPQIAEASLDNVQGPKGQQPVTQPTATTEPWFYGWLEMYANQLRAAGVLINIMGMILTVIPFLYLLSKEPVYALFFLLGAVLIWLWLYLSVVLLSAFLLVIVDSGRNLRAIRQETAGRQ